MHAEPQPTSSRRVPTPPLPPQLVLFGVGASLPTPPLSLLPHTSCSWRTLVPFKSQSASLGVFQRTMWSDGAQPLLQSPGLQLALIGIDCLSAQYVKPSRNSTCTHSISLFSIQTRKWECMHACRHTHTHTCSVYLLVQLRVVFKFPWDIRDI